MIPEYTVGYVPATFPRDPIELNQFAEHMYLGQILEPLIELDRSGEVRPCLGERYEVSEDKRVLTFEISDRQFSNGQKVTAQDVAYSISRHLGTKSQSAVFLADVESVTPNGERQVVVNLKKANVAIVKAISRDQLGIVPNHWRFDANAVEPYIGTGPYRLVKAGDVWQLLPNQKFSRNEFRPRLTWKMLTVNNDPGQLLTDELPGYMPIVAQSSLNHILKRTDFDRETYKVNEIVAYSQTSFWIHPSSKLFGSILNRQSFAFVFGNLVDLFSVSHRLPRATGLFPSGIQGHNQVAQKLTVSSTLPTDSLKIAYMRGTFSPFIESTMFKKFIAANHIDLELIPWDASDASVLHTKEIDVVTGSWAGGYNDPTGFFGLLPVILGRPLEDYLEHNVLADLTVARNEQEPKLREQKFQAFDRSLVRSGLLIPGWRTPTYSLLRKPLRASGPQNHFTERFAGITDQP